MNLEIQATAPFNLHKYSHGDIKWGTDISFASTRKLKLYTHRLFNRYPARSISLVPRAILNDLATDRTRKKGLRVLDPFMGSGTSAIEASLLGIDVSGVELDPFARLISEVSYRGIDRGGENRIKETFNEIIKNWKKYRPDKTYAPQLANMEYWFSADNYTNLLKLKRAIYSISSDEDLPFFKIVFADIIRPCSKAERQSLKPYISKQHTKIPAPVGNAFLKSFTNCLSSVLEYSEEINYRQPELNWLSFNATTFNSSKKFDAAITSPPYINALDYIRCIKMESSWVDCCNDQTLKELRKYQIGDLKKGNFVHNHQIEPIIVDCYKSIAEKDTLRAGVMYKYFDDMFQNFKSVYNVLAPNSCYHVIIGNSTIRGVEIPTHKYLAKIGELVGFRWNGYYRYKIKDHRLSIPRNNNGGKIEFEHVISLTKY